MNLMQPSGEYSLNEVWEKFKQWHNSRDRGKAIPEALWEAAASLYPPSQESLARNGRGFLLVDNPN